MQAGEVQERTDAVGAGKQRHYVVSKRKHEKL